MRAPLHRREPLAEVVAVGSRRNPRLDLAVGFALEPLATVLPRLRICRLSVAQLLEELVPALDGGAQQGRGLFAGVELILDLAEPRDEPRASLAEGWRVAAGLLDLLRVLVGDRRVRGIPGGSFAL